MGTNQTKAKMKYNKREYVRYEFNVNKGTKLHELIIRFKEDKENNFSELIKTSLCEHFGIDRLEADDLYTLAYLENGEWERNKELDKYLEFKEGINTWK